jgi:hypothetical protein
MLAIFLAPEYIIKNETENNDYFTVSNVLAETVCKYYLHTYLYAFQLYVFIKKVTSFYIFTGGKK